MLSRRRVLVLAGGAAVVPTALLGACTGPGAPEPDPVADALAALLASERRLVARYAAAIGAHPALTSRLTPIREDHAAHADALRDLLSARRSPSPTASPSSGETPPPVPATTRAALADLAAAETAAAAAATSACLLADGDTAALLASVAACEASHLVVVR